MNLFELHSIWTERVCLRACGDTSGPVVTTWVSDCQGNEAAQEGITRGSENGDAGADRQAQQGAATDARAVGDYIPKFNRAARREMLARLHEDAQKEHREACPKPSPAVPKSDHRRSEEHTSELQPLRHLVCRLLLEKK